MVDEVEQNWRANEKSRESAVLEAVRDVDRAKKATFCMSNGCGEEEGEGRGVNSLKKMLQCLVSSKTSPLACCKSRNSQLGALQITKPKAQPKIHGSWWT